MNLLRNSHPGPNSYELRAVWRLVSVLLLVAVQSSAMKSGNTDYDFDYKSNVLFPSLPIAAPWAKNSACRNESRLLLKELRSYKLWAMQMWDASAKIPVGILNGNTYELGDFDECLAVKRPVRAQYCLAHITVTPPHTGVKVDPYTLHYDPEIPAWEKMRYRGDHSKIRRDQLYIALCVPASCSHEDLELSVTQYLAKLPDYDAAVEVEVPKDACQVATDEVPLTTASQVYLAILITLALLVLIGTYYDYEMSAALQKDVAPTSRMQKLLLYFSARRNMRPLTGEVHRSHALDCLTSIKLICIGFIILDHRAAVNAANTFHNGDYVDSQYRSVGGKILQQGALIVDSFFLISGLLFAFLHLGELDRGVPSFFKTVFNRFIRLTPAYMMTVFFYAFLMHQLGSGPNWPLHAQYEIDYCQENWWTNLLYINNFVREERYCIVQSFFLSCDMQLFICAVPLVGLMWRNPKLGGWLLAGLTTLSILVPAVVTYLGKKEALFHMYQPFLKYPRKQELYSTFYTKSWARACPYFVGVALGYVLNRIQGSKIKMQKAQSVIMFGVSVSILSATVAWGSIFYDQTKPYDALEAGIFAGLHKLTWSLGTALFIFILIHGYVPIVSPVLYWKPLISIGNLGYSLFLIHFMFQYTSSNMMRSPLFFTYLELFRMTVADITLAMIGALILYLAVEAPFGLLARDLLAPARKPKSKTASSGPQHGDKAMKTS